MDTTPGEWTAETWLTLAVVLVGLVVVAYGLALGSPILPWFGVGFILLALFVWVGL